jgi:hypothetical protein
MNNILRPPIEPQNINHHSFYHLLFNRQPWAINYQPSTIRIYHQPSTIDNPPSTRNRPPSVANHQLLTSTINH